MTNTQKIKSFCLIQLQVIKDREMMLRKEIQNCKLQVEFLEKTIEDLSIEREIDSYKKK
jgi:hypothetical protein